MEAPACRFSWWPWLCWAGERCIPKCLAKPHLWRQLWLWVVRNWAWSSLAKRKTGESFNKVLELQFFFQKVQIGVPLQPFVFSRKFQRYSVRSSDLSTHWKLILFLHLLVVKIEMKDESHGICCISLGVRLVLWLFRAPFPASAWFLWARLWCPPAFLFCSTWMHSASLVRSASLSDCPNRLYINSYDELSRLPDFLSALCV